MLISGLLTEDGGNSESAILNRRCLGKDFFPIGTFDNNISPQHIHQRQRMSCRWDTVEVERGDIFGVIKHGPELLGVALKFSVGEVEPSEIGHFGDIVASKTGGHR